MIFEKLQDLCNGIIEQAVKDYRKALAGEYVEHKAPKDVIAECERFFRSTWFSLLTIALYIMSAATLSNANPRNATAADTGG